MEDGDGGGGRVCVDVDGLVYFVERRFEALFRPTRASRPSDPVFPFLRGVVAEDRLYTHARARPCCCCAFFFLRGIVVIYMPTTLP